MALTCKPFTEWQLLISGQVTLISLHTDGYVSYPDATDNCCCVALQPNHPCKVVLHSQYMIVLVLFSLNSRGTILLCQSLLYSVELASPNDGLVF